LIGADSRWQMLFPSPRYGVEALVKLIEAVDAKAMLTPDTPLPIMTKILQKKEMTSYQIPSVEQCFATKVDKYPFTKTFEECKDEEMLCLRESPVLALFLSNLLSHFNLLIPKRRHD
jgi:hypothetical protein